MQGYSYELLHAADLIKKEGECRGSFLSESCCLVFNLKGERRGSFLSESCCAGAICWESEGQGYNDMGSIKVRV